MALISYSVAHRAGLLPTELTGMRGWILLRSPHQGRGSPPAPAPTKQRPPRRAAGARSCHSPGDLAGKGTRGQVVRTAVAQARGEGHRWAARINGGWAEVSAPPSLPTPSGIILGAVCFEKWMGSSVRSAAIHQQFVVPLVRTRAIVFLSFGGCCFGAVYCSGMHGRGE